MGRALMRTVIFAAALTLGAAIGVAAPARADVTLPVFASPAPVQNRFLADAQVKLAAVAADEQAKTGVCNLTALRIGMYAAQAVDAFGTAAAVRGRATSRTAYGASSSAASYIATQAVFDALAGALTRRASCKEKIALSAVVAGSALLNASKDGSK